jgi:hypothetical protein
MFNFRKTTLLFPVKKPIKPGKSERLKKKIKSKSRGKWKI